MSEIGGINGYLDVDNATLRAPQIGIANTTPQHALSVGSNLYVSSTSPDVLTVDGNVVCEGVKVGLIEIYPSYGFGDVSNVGNATANTIQFTNATTAFVTSANIEVGTANLFVDTQTGRVGVGTNAPAYDLDVHGTANVGVLTANLPIATIASNLVTYDKTTGELFDSAGLFSNKLAVVSEQPPAALTGATTTIENHGTYTIATGDLNLFDKNDSTTWTGTYATLTLPYKATLRHLKMVADSFPTTVTVEGSNNGGLTWDELATPSGAATMLVNATAPYKKYKFSFGGEVTLKRLDLFTESFSIDGGKVAMASSAVMGGETMMDQHGPHGRGVAVLKKYPEIIFEEGKFEFNESTNTYTQAGYTVTASGEHLTENWGPAWGAFDDDTTTEENGWIPPSEFMGQNNQYIGLSTIGGTLGAWLKIKMTHKIRLEYIVLYPRYKYGSDSVSPYTDQSPKTFQILGSDNDNDWESLASFDNESQPNAGKRYTVNAIKHFKYIAIRVTRSNSNGPLVIGELKLYGYEELATQGDTSVDTTFTSVMNTPQTTGVKVYVDGNLGETFTNRVTGPTPTGTATSYNETGKYWELTGALTSNVTLEANTFLEGDAPHSVSVWFNSSNLEANVSNTCVFSISDQEKLDSVNLDLQSNTWHNLTYAYQGEGGSRVTYLDGRKVAEDQTEDTFGEYPPFAMTGYSQGGYVVSASSDYYANANWRAWKVFNDVEGDEGWHTSSINDEFLLQDYNGTSSLGGVGGAWLKLEMPHKLRLSYIYLTPRIYTDSQEPEDFKILGSNDDENWTELVDVIGASWPTPIVGRTFTMTEQTQSFKYLALIVTRTTGSGVCLISELKYYGHRENDLVRLPDPTNVLKYPHIAMTGPAQRGYVASASSKANDNNQYGAWGAFNGNVEEGTSEGWGSEFDTYNNANPSLAVTSGSLATHFNSHYGEYINIKLPHKILLSKIHTFPRTGNENPPIVRTNEHPDAGYLYGSNDGFSTFQEIYSFDGVTVSSTYNVPVIHTIPSSHLGVNLIAYDEYRFQITRLKGQNRFAVVSEMELYGTEEATPVPIQIGGGNIDKVANFRVYDRFIDENQALEIWDAQKDEFGRAKSSMTLHKGRLGIGTTEPEGRLAVLDEPNGLEEFPPRAMTGYETYMEGHGVFRANGNSNGSTVYRTFTKNSNLSWTTLVGSAPGNPYNSSTGYTDTTRLKTSLSSEIPIAPYILLELPYKIKLSRYEWQTGENATYHVTAGIREVEIWAQNTGDTIWKLVNASSTVTPTTTFEVFSQTVNSSTYYDKYAFIAIRTNGNANGTIGEIRYFGTREQGQSVLHDGQLTLTKSLNVPRIGPALDADDTPRRDRLVVEYNTSTNPTFEGAVRDTSGRGNDAVLLDGAYYDATEKALDISAYNGSAPAGSQTAHIKSGILPGFTGNQAHTMSFWIKTGSDMEGSFVTLSPQSGESNYKVSMIYYEPTNNRFKIVGWSNDFYVNVSLSTGRLYHITLTYEGATVETTTKKLYINGVQQTNTTTLSEGSAINFTDTIVCFGEYVQGGGEINGSISNFKLYDCALTAEEVKTLYDMGRCDEGHHVVNFSKTRVGIGLGDGETPRGALDVRGGAPFIGPGLVIDQAASGNWGAEGDPANMNGLFLTRTGEAGLSGSNYWNMSIQGTGGSSLLFAHRGKVTAYIHQNNANNALDFTGQHRSFIKDVPFAQASNLEGLIVSSDQNKYIKLSGGIEAGSNAITINESLPVVSLSTTTNDKKCFGVISASEDPENRSDAYGSFVTPFEKEKGDTRVYINSVGEGAIWVVNTNGSLESGDYITTSNVAGYGQKQDDDILHNYTVAKITMDCDFEPATQPVQQILRSNVVETYYLGNVHKVKSVPHEFVTTVVGADDEWSNVSVSPSDVTYAEWSNLEANTQNTYTLTYTQTSNVVYDVKYTLTTTANVAESDPWDNVFIDPPNVSYAEYSNLEANTQNTYTLTFTQTTTDEKTPEEWSALESNTQSLYNKVYYQSVEEEVAPDYPGAVAHTRVTDVIENELDEHGQIQWEDHPTETEKAYKIRYLDASGAQTDEANAVHIAAFVGCTYHCG